jgi:pimeloyl-ACP methyl ester carboxylesterase
MRGSFSDHTGHERSATAVRFSRVSTRILAAAAAAGTILAVVASALSGATNVSGVAQAKGKPQVAWQPCAGAVQTLGLAFECASLRVPLDYRHPRRDSIRLALIRLPAGDPTQRIGTLFFNPGGPGAGAFTAFPGIAALGLFPPEVLARFDLVSWDPRGTGRSAAVQCFSSMQAENRFLRHLPSGFPLGSRGKASAYVRRWARFGRRCERRSGHLLGHVSTADTARDLDRLRRAVGDRRLNYLGISYGTFLGATYANLFPKRVRAMVLDGNVEPKAWISPDLRANGGRFLSTELRLGTDRGSASTLRAFLRLCGSAGAGACPFSAGSPAATEQKFRVLLRRLRQRGKVAGTTYPALITLIAQSLDNVQPVGQSANWPGLAQSLEQLWGVLANGSRSRAAASLNRARPDGRYAGPEQQYAIYCADSPSPTAASYPRLARFAKRRSGPLGPYWAWLPEPCSTWPAKTADRYAGPWNRRTRNPILVIGNTHDPSTPIFEARAMSRRLARARLLTVDGYGHTALLNPSSCALAHESRYLVEGVLPPKGARCTQDQRPFSG